MTGNVVQFPYPKLAEPPVDFRLRLELWRKERGWATWPQDRPLTWDQRIEIQKRLIENRPMPLFIAAEMRSVS